MTSFLKQTQKSHCSLWLFCLGLILCQITNLLLGKSAVINSGLFFGLAGNNLLAIIISLATITLVLLLIRDHKGTNLPLIVVLAGAFSNIIDRIIYSGTLDYLHLWSIPTFNLADVLIVSGSALWLTFLLLDKKRGPETS